MQLERDIGQAEIKRDYAFLERVEADELVFTLENGVSRSVAPLPRGRGASTLGLWLGKGIAQLRVHADGSTNQNKATGVSTTQLAAAG